MATRVKRLIVGAAALAAFGSIGTTPASAQATATFSSPASAPATQPIWVRSITPCPRPTPGITSWVVARLLQATDLAEGDAVWGQVRSDGAWDVTLSAPAGPGGGATSGYLVQVQCGTTEQPPADDFDDEIAPIITQRYVSRELQVTSGVASGAQWIDGPIGGPATTSTTTTAPTTTTTAPTSTTTTAPTATSTTTTSTTQLANVVTSFGGASAIQAEILKKAAIDEVRRTSTPQDFVALNASPASAARTEESSGGGIPAWSFACAAALAVGAVLAWGQRRSAPVEIDE